MPTKECAELQETGEGVKRLRKDNQKGVPAEQAVQVLPVVCRCLFILKGSILETKLFFFRSRSSRY